MGTLKKLIKELSNAALITRNTNIILVGLNGTGKTLLAITLDYLATLHNIKVRFVSVVDLLRQLETAQCQGRYKKTLQRTVPGEGMIVIGEIGYLPMTNDQINLFFQVVAKCYECGSVILISNLSFGECKSIFLIMQL